MRAYEFINPHRDSIILREYKRDITARNYGDQLLQTLANSSLSGLPDDLYHATTLISAAMYPASWDPKKQYKVTVVNRPVTFGSANAAEILEQLKPEIIEAILTEIESHDPTKNKEYTQWLARIWINSGGQVKFEDLNRNDLLMAYDVAKKKNLLRSADRDINRFKTLKDFETMIKTYNVEELLNIALASDGGYGNARVINSYASATIVIPLDLDASRRAAGGMGPNSAEWCTKSELKFNQYTSKGPLYILIPRKPQYQGERYQLHFPTIQFMDKNDDSVSLYSLLSREEGRFPDLFPFFKEVEPGITDFVVFMYDDEIMPLIEAMQREITKHIKEVIFEWHNDDEGYARARGFVDDTGAVDWDKLSQDRDLASYLKYNQDARYFAHDVLNSYLPSNPEELREAINKQRDSERIFDEPRVSDLPDVMARAYRDATGGNDFGDVAKYLERYITFIRPMDLRSDGAWKIFNTDTSFDR